MDNAVLDSGLAELDALVSAEFVGGVSKSVGTMGTVGTVDEESRNHPGLRAVPLFPNDENAVGTNGETWEQAPKKRRGHTEFLLSDGIGDLKAGVYWLPPTLPDKDPIPPMWLCSTLRVIAETRDSQQGNWGRLLQWYDGDGHLHQWACPAELLTVADASEFRRELARNGLVISSRQKARQKIVDYVLGYPCESDVRMRCVTRVGWNVGRYVTPAAVFGERSGEGVIYQGGEAGDFSTAGSLDDWRSNVAAPASGNSRIVFALSASFAGPLLEMSGEPGGGFHFVGTTSKGKTSMLLHPAASVWGKPEAFARKWRATTNGLEGLCLSRNDSLLILDEIAQVSPHDAGSAAYLIANGQGKARMNKDNTNRPSQTWRTLLLSAGEIDLSQHMAEAGKAAKGGQMARLPAIPCDAGAGMGVLENLHDFENGDAFSKAMQNSAGQFYGIAGAAFLDKLTDPATLAEVSKEIAACIAAIVLKFDINTNAASEVFRVASRFALVAFAGELASSYGVTGWKAGEAIKAGRRCFRDWLADAGGGIAADERALLDAVCTYMQANHASKFPDHDAEPEALARFGAITGYRFTNGLGEVEFWILPGPMNKEIIKGFNATWARQTLINHGFAKQGDTNGGKQRTTTKKRIKAHGSAPTNVFVLTSDVLTGGG